MHAAKRPPEERAAFVHDVASRLRGARHRLRAAEHRRAARAVTGAGPARPTKAEVAAAAGRTVPDVLAPGLRVVFVGINPGLYSAATGHHFARPGNRFWKALHAGGLTPRVLRPDEERELLALGMGVTNIVARSTAVASELSADELRAGARALERKLRRARPAFAAFLGLGAYRTAFARPRAVAGEQPERIGDTRVWLLPNPSGLNANHQLPDLAARVRRAGEGGGHRRAAASAAGRVGCAAGDDEAADHRGNAFPGPPRGRGGAAPRPRADAVQPRALGSGAVPGGRAADGRPRRRPRPAARPRVRRRPRPVRLRAARGRAVRRAVARRDRELPVHLQRIRRTRPRGRTAWSARTAGSTSRRRRTSRRSWSTTAG